MMRRILSLTLALLLALTMAACGAQTPAAPEAPSADSQAAGFTAVETDELPF